MKRRSSERLLIRQRQFSGARSAFALYVLPLLIALVCVLIIDLDRARFGFVRAGDGPMERVERDIAAAFPATSAAR